MIPCSAFQAGALAAMSILFLILFLIAIRGRRFGRRLQLVEAALSRAQFERAELTAIPQPIDDFDPLEITLPRFIGSPHPPRRLP